MRALLRWAIVSAVLCVGPVAAQTISGGPATPTTTTAGAPQLGGSCVSGAVNVNIQTGDQWICTNSAWTNVSTAFVTSGLLADYRMTEGSGSVLNDASGNGNTFTMSGSVLPTWTLDNGLQWSMSTTSGSSTSAIALPVAIQNVQTIEIAIGRANSSLNQWNVPIIYTGGTPGIGILLNMNWLGTSYANPTGVMGYSTQWVGFRQDNGNYPISSLGVIDNGFHIITLVNNTSSGVATLYLDGLMYANTSTAYVSSSPAGGTWDLGNASPGTQVSCGNVTKNLCGYQGITYGVRMFSTALTAAQVFKDYQAFYGAMKSKGANVQQSGAGWGALTNTNNTQLVSMTESIGWGHGQANPVTSNYPYLAAADLTAQLGYTVSSIIGGNDSNNAFVMQNECVPHFVAYRSPQGVNIALIDDNANNVSGYYGVLAGVPPFPNAASVQKVAEASVGAIAACVQSLKAKGWWVLVGTAISRYSNSNSGDDTNIKDVYNPLLRQQLGGLADGIYDFANDSRWGADGAGQSGPTSTNCSGGAAYLSDTIHPTLCGQQVFGYMVAQSVLAMFNKRNTPTITSASTNLAMTGANVYATTVDSGAAATIMLPQCGGLEPGAWVQIYNSGSGTDTITAATEYNGGATDTIVGVTTLATGTLGKWLNRFNGDTVGTCSWQQSL